MSSDLSAIPEPVQWHEGMLLSPQHFQQQSQRGERLLHYHLAQAAPYHWGVTKLEIDPAQLAMGSLRVLALEAILPDGLAVTYPQKAARAALDLDLRPYAEALHNAPAKIWLAVPARRADLVSGRTGETARYRSIEGEEVVDENTGDNPIRLPRLQPNLLLTLGERPSAKYTALPIAAVSFESDAFTLTAYVPPLLQVALDQPLGRTCLKLAQTIRHKASFLAARAQGAGGAERQAALLETRSALSCLVGGLPSFEAALNSGRAHPFTLFLLACALAGQVAPLGPGMVPPIFDHYDHDDIVLSFKPLLGFIERVVETISERYAAIAFALEGNIFRLLLDPSWFDGDLLMGVRGRAGGSEQDVVAWMEECVIGDAEHIGAMVEARIRGAARSRVIDAQGLDLVPARGTIAYRIANDKNFITPGRMLEVINPRDVSGGGSRRPVEIVLYARTPFTKNP
ncbi:MAG TPA: type VI secretion system baseplate subunit TssK [Stellaceae bacterium]|nr:type VI secretion system baseplate subunit TssK [Stellaceae bacterium]